MNRPPYCLELESTVPDGPPTYRFRTADGVCSKDSFRTPELLLLEHVWGTDPGDVLSVEANYGVVGTVLSSAADSVRMTESSARATRLCELNARENDAAATVSLATGFSTSEGKFDTVTYAPKPFTPVEIGNARLRRGLSQLRPDGRLYLAASKRSGLSRYETCLRETGAAVDRVASGGEYRLLEATPTTASRESTPRSPVESRTLRPTVDGIDLSLVTVPGVFSASELDEGTRLLLESATVTDGDRTLDLCCGYGAAGAYAARTADCEVWLSDDDRVATLCAGRSLRASGVDGT
ncbi:methyltransferase, partial [Halobium palmae]